MGKHADRYKGLGGADGRKVITLMTDPRLTDSQGNDVGFVSLVPVGANGLDFTSVKSGSPELDDDAFLYVDGEDRRWAVKNPNGDLDVDALVVAKLCAARAHDLSPEVRTGLVAKAEVLMSQARSALKAPLFNQDQGFTNGVGPDGFWLSVFAPLLALGSTTTKSAAVVAKEGPTTFDAAINVPKFSDEFWDAKIALSDVLRNILGSEEMDDLAKRTAVATALAQFSAHVNALVGAVLSSSTQMNAADLAALDGLVAKSAARGSTASGSHGAPASDTMRATGLAMLSDLETRLAAVKQLLT